MDQAELELQLKVWKDLAITKQVLMRAATDALKLDPDCGAEELKQALDAAIKKSIDADVTVSKAQEQADVAIAVMEKKVAENQKAQAIAENLVSETLEAKKTYEQQMSVERESHIKEMKKVKDQLSEKDKTIKAINKALADTPENVVKKLKTLKKQKFDEAEARKRCENEIASLKKEKKQLEKRIGEMEEKLNNAGQLVEQQRELHKISEELRDQLKSHVENAEDLPVIPQLNEKFLEDLEGNSEDKA